jgi:hypothetical protein
MSDAHELGAPLKAGLTLAPDVRPHGGLTASTRCGGSSGYSPRATYLSESAETT